MGGVILKEILLEAVRKRRMGVQLEVSKGLVKEALGVVSTEMVGSRAKDGKGKVGGRNERYKNSRMAGLIIYVNRFPSKENVSSVQDDDRNISDIRGIGNIRKTVLAIPTVGQKVHNMTEKVLEVHKDFHKDGDYGS